MITGTFCIIYKIMIDYSKRGDFSIQLAAGLQVVVEMT